MRVLLVGSPSDRARLRAQLRLYEQSEEAVFTIGPFTFRPSQKLLVEEAARRKVHLTEKETAILKYLYRAAGQVVGREKLLGEVWGFNAAVTTHTLDPCLSPAPEDRERSRPGRDPGHRAGRLSTEPLTGFEAGAGAFVASRVVSLL